MTESSLGKAQLGRFPRRAMVISLLLPVLSTLVVGGICAGDLVSWFRHSSNATTVVAGRGDPVGEFGSDDTVRMDVWWKDATGEGRQAQFRVPDGRQLPRDQPFQIRYDPADPDGLVFPAGEDADRVIPPSPRWWVLLIALPFLILTAGIALGWWRRAQKAAVAAAAPTGVRYRVVPFVLQGTQLSFGGVKTIDVGLGTLLFPADEPFDADAFRVGHGFVRPPGVRWQRTMWSPSFAALEPGQEVTAHVSEGEDGRAVLVTDRGTVWPAGSLRDRDLPGKQPALVAFRSPSNSRVRPGAAYLVAPLTGFCVAPVALSSPAALLIVPFALLFGYGMTIATWAWRSGIPAER